MSTTHTLLYFNIHGLAARIRLAFAVAGLPYTDSRFASRDAFTEMKASGELPFGQVPCLLVTDAATGATTKLAQSSAILRYVCALGGLYPGAAAPLLAAQVDAQVQAAADAMAALGVLTYPARNGLAHLAEADVAAGLEAQRADVLPRHLGYLEAALGAAAGGGAGWVCATARPSPADFAWGTQLRDIRVGAVAAVPPAVLAPFPRINAFLDKFLAVPEVAAYYAANP
jgi:hypothetical protein